MSTKQQTIGGVRKSSMARAVIWRAITTVVIFIGWSIFNSLYRAVQGPLEGSVVADQFKNNAAAYAASRVVVNGAIPQIISWSAFVLILVIWGTLLISVLRSTARKSAQQ